ncbi:MAG: hypothetical protein ACYDEB_05620 [Dehalococcoidia bacterium]
MTADAYILSRIEAIEAEIANLKKQLRTRPHRTVESLHGILEGLDVPDEDFEAAKRSWEKRVEDV